MSAKLKSIVVFLLLMLCSVSCFSSSEFSTETFTARSGLPSSTVFSVIEDDTGYIWVGTPSGIAVLDGDEILEYTKLVQHSEPFPLISPGNLYVDSKNQIWAGSWGQGAVKISKDRKSYTYYAPDSGSMFLGAQKIQSFLETSDGIVWIGTATNGLVEVVEKRQIIVNRRASEHEGSISDNRVWDMLEDENENLWIATSNGLNYFDREENHFTQYLNQSTFSASARQIRTIYRLQDEIWLGSRAGLAKFDVDTKQYTPFSFPEDKEFIVNDIIYDGNKGLWIATFLGVYYFDLKREEFKLLSNGEFAFNPTDDIRQLRISAGGFLWAATRESGLIKVNLNSTTFSHYLNQNEEDPRGNKVWKIDSATDDILWLATSNGIRLFDKVKKSFIDTPAVIKSQLSERVYSLQHETNDIVWIGTLTNIYRYQKSTNELQEYGQQLSESGITEISAIAIDSSGLKWFSASEQGVFSLSDAGDIERFTHKKNIPSLSSNQVSKILEDRLGNLWASTVGSGINVKYAGEPDFIPFQLKFESGVEYVDRAVLDFWVGKNDTLWLASYNGLIQVNTKTGVAIQFTTRDGLASNEIKIVRQDESGLLWLGTSRGVSQFNPARQSFVNFSDVDGINGNRYGSEAGHIDIHGNLFFGGDRGFNMLNPTQINLEKDNFPVLIKDIWVNNLSLDAFVLGREEVQLSLSHTENNIRIAFASLDFRDADYSRLNYRLEGFEEIWHTANEGKTANYTNLFPGHYRFVVRDTLQGKSKEAVIKLTITQPLWQQTSFKVAVGLVLILFAYSTYYVRVSRLEKRRVKLERVIEERTLELQNKNDELVLANQQLEEISLTDQMTGLRNRRFLLEFIEEDVLFVNRKFREWKKSQLSSVQETNLIFLLFDLDDFREINDTFGHDAGDEILKQIPAVITPLFRENDYFIRWGGEEILVVARFTQRDYASVLAERLKVAIEEHKFRLPCDKIVYKTASIGFACYPFDTQDPERYSWQDVIKLADMSLYAVKRSGKNDWLGVDLGTESDDDKPSIESLLNAPEQAVSNKQIRIHHANRQSVNWGPKSVN